MKANVRDFITIAHGKQFWEDLESSVDVVLTAPNGWDGRTQQRMRKAATSAQLVGPEEGNRIRFLSEGEVRSHNRPLYIGFPDQVITIGRYSLLHGQC